MNGKIRILLIEDNPGDARLFREMLKEAADIQFEVETADRLALGLDYLKHNPVDAVILDLGLPDSQGFSTLMKLNEIKPEAPVIVLTGLADETIGTQAVKEGAQDYLIKGQIDKNLLSRSIRYAIERKQTEAEREKIIIELRNAFAKIKTLSGMLPICASCKKIRDDKGYWNQLEKYISEHSETQFSHGLCPECAKKAMKDFEEFVKDRKQGQSEE